MAGSDTDEGGAVSLPSPWDPLVRLTHWAVVAAVVTNGFIVKEGGTAHIWIGWALMAVLAVRFLWGLIGPSEARFSAFPPDPRAALSHVADLIRGRAREHPSHNPAGALMVYALWACLVVVTATGLVMTDAKSPLRIAEEKAAVAAGDWSVLVREDGEDHDDDHEGKGGDRVEEIHEMAANLVLILAAIHVAGVAVESRALGRNLVRPMIGGRS